MNLNQSYIQSDHCAWFQTIFCVKSVLVINVNAAKTAFFKSKKGQIKCVLSQRDENWPLFFMMFCLQISVMYFSRNSWYNHIEGWYLFRSYHTQKNMHNHLSYPLPANDILLYFQTQWMKGILKQKSSK